MASLWDVYETLANTDQKLVEKIAANAAPAVAVAEETAKLAADYDEAGRRLARAHWAQKLAEEGHVMPFAGKETPEEEAAEEKLMAAKKKKKASDKSEDERKDEKTAAIAQRLMSDPDYRAHLIAKYHGQG